MENTQRFIDVEKQGVQNSKDIAENNIRTRSNTHRIDKLEKQVDEIKKETSTLGELNAILKVQTEINVNQAKHMEKFDQILQNTAQNLTELNLITKQLQVNQDKIVTEQEKSKVNLSHVWPKIFWGLVAIVPSLVMAYILYRTGWK